MKYLRCSEKLSLLGLFPLIADGIAVDSEVLLAVLVVTSTEVASSESVVVSELIGEVVVVPLSPSRVVVGASVVTGEASCLGYCLYGPATTKSKQMTR